MINGGDVESGRGDVINGKARKEPTEEMGNENGKCKSRIGKGHRRTVGQREREREQRDSPYLRVDFPDPVSAMT